MPREELWTQNSCGTDLSFFFGHGSNMRDKPIHNDGFCFYVFCFTKHWDII